MHTNAPMTVEQALEAATRALGQGRWEEAERLGRQVIATVPNSVRALTLLGATFLATLRFHLSIDMARMALALAPRDTTALYNYATALRCLAQPDDAEGLYRKVLEYAPAFERARRALQSIEAARRADAERAPFLHYRRNEHSQNGEDGVIAEILSRLGITGGWFCEFGAWDGVSLSNTYSLAKRGWRGVYIEAMEDRYRDLLATCAKFPPDQLFPINAFVHDSRPGETLDDLLATTPIPADFDVLSIDIDSYYYQIWDSLARYRPKIVVIEVNSSYAPPLRVVHAEGGNGSSFQAVAELGKRKGYTIVCHTGNVIAVRDDLVPRLGLPPRVLESPESVFLENWSPWEQRRTAAHAADIVF